MHADKPGVPQSCTVSDVFYDNCMVHWTKPEDDGGTEIKSYVVEALDVTAGGKWSPVAHTDTGGETEIKFVSLTLIYYYTFNSSQH